MRTWFNAILSAGLDLLSGQGPSRAMEYAAGYADVLRFSPF